MDFKPNDESITSESAPLIEPIDCESDRDLFMVPLKRPSPRLPPSRYRNVKARTPPRSPAALSPRSILEKSPRSGVNPYQSPAMSGQTIKPDSPPMFTSPLMSPESGVLGLHDGLPNLDGLVGQRNMATPGSLVYNSPPMSVRATKVGSSLPVMSPDAGSARQSPELQSSSKEHTTTESGSTREKAASASTKASSVYDSPPVIVEVKPAEEPDTTPKIPPLSAARGLGSSGNTTTPSTKLQTLGLALRIDNPNLLAPPGAATGTLTNPKSPGTWTVPDSPLERLSQMRATPDSAYDRARQMEVRRSEWKHVVYRFPVKGQAHWVIDADLTESSHARLADVARRSSEGFEWNGDYELANIYRVLAVAHTRVMEEMRGERRGVVAAAAAAAVAAAAGR
ncbi:hypothetical protein C8A00DRAFT_36581 [Chaetomidium leptoderma]|uniref:Uncharacterized protein n=1 Tax=Chaetomidium leptoderma TaxID=669021 RepID=A0AAN6VFZ4_9PEZI|nr:hypothetical protein C8A00DRAFT_36581 [Chaetomidium leptoderma]